MRPSLYAVFMGFTLVSMPAAAGSISVNDGKVSWQSTQCMAPVTPPSLAAVNHETPAEDMNKRVTEYNQYAMAMQSYLDCISKEAQTDASATSQSVVSAAQAVIETSQKNMAELAAPLQKKE